MKYLKIFEGFDNYDIETIKDIFEFIIVYEYDIEEKHHNIESVTGTDNNIFYEFKLKGSELDIWIWREGKEKDSSDVYNKMLYKFLDIRDVGLKELEKRMKNIGHDISYNKSALFNIKIKIT